MSQWRHHDQKDAFLGEKESMANERQAKSTVDLTGILVCSVVPKPVNCPFFFLWMGK